MNENKEKQELIDLEQQIKYAEKNGQPIKEYVLREIDILQNAIDQFLDYKDKEGLRYSGEVLAVEIRQYATMRELANKIGESSEKYDELIKQAQCKVCGVENWDLFFS